MLLLESEDKELVCEVLCKNLDMVFCFDEVFCLDEVFCFDEVLFPATSESSGSVLSSASALEVNDESAFVFDTTFTTPLTAFVT